MATISIAKITRELDLKVIYDGGKDSIEIASADMNRPGLQLAGFFDYFAHARAQIFGNVENSFLEKMTSEERSKAFEKLFAYGIPFVLLSKNPQPFPEMLEQAHKFGVTVLKSEHLLTSKLEHTLINYLNTQLAPMMTTHGVLMDVFGVGILLMGDSGIGKSETALELVNRGHRLVADDAVIIRKIADDRLVGEAPEIIRHLMEIRGIGIVNIEHMYGVGSVINNKSVDIVIYLEFWDESKEYDRLGLADEHIELLDVKLPKIVVPVRPGRNLAIIMEVAARNYRLKLMGYSALNEITQRRQKLLEKDENK